VDKHSALLDIPGEDQIPADANHEEICKFAHRDDGPIREAVQASEANATVGGYQQQGQFKYVDKNHAWCNF
jgi:hypothetical protein